MDNRKHTNEILKALDGARKAVPPKDMLSRMENIALAYAQKTKGFSTQVIVGIAASVLLLIVSNVYMLSTVKIQESQDVVVQESEYNLVPTKSLYDE